MKTNRPYVEPLRVTDIKSCDFYHTMELPGHGTVPGGWDLRAGVDAYLGHTQFKGKRVLDVGAASGFLTFAMEQRGADVVSYDLSENDPWDVLPFASTDFRKMAELFRTQKRRLNCSYWYAHRLLGSRARKAQGTVYAIPPEIGMVDIAVFGSILLHLRDPLLALQKALQLTKERVIVTDVLPRRRFWQSLLGVWGRPALRFLPNFRTQRTGDTWWELTPALIREFIGVLGFEDARLSYHRQPFLGKTRLMFTVVGRRTRPAAILEQSASAA